MDNLNWKEDLPQYTEPSAIKKWRFLSSWEQYIGEIYAVEKEDGELIIYFELEGENLLCRENSLICAHKFPHKLLEYYESEFVLKQAD